MSTNRSEGIEPDHQSPPQTFQGLPTEAIHRVFSFLTLRAAARTGRVSSTLATAFASLPKNDVLFRRNLLARLGLSALVQTAAGENDGECDWRDAVREMQVLFRQLRGLGSIEGKIQKYLRWCDGAAGDSHQVLHALVGISLLPSNIEDLFCQETGGVTRDGQLVLQFFFDGMEIPNRIAFAWKDTPARIDEMQVKLDDMMQAVEEQGQGLALLEEMAGRSKQFDFWEGGRVAVTREQCEAATRHFDVNRFVRIVRWFTVAADHGEERPLPFERHYPSEQRKLRILMAEFEQIDTRDSRFFINKNLSLKAAREMANGSRASGAERQLGAFVQLHRLSQCDPEGLVTYWA